MLKLREQGNLPSFMYTNIKKMAHKKFSVQTNTHTHILCVDIAFMWQNDELLNFEALSYV